MATPDADTYHTAQVGLAAELASEVRQALAAVDLSHLKQSIPQLRLEIAALVHRYGKASATLSVRAYLERRAASGIRTGFTPTTGPLPPLEQVGRTVDWATKPLWGQSDLDAATQLLTGATDMLTLDVGRDTTIRNVVKDRQAKAWARIPEAGCCYFCAMLATRGAVYKEHAFDAANATFAGVGVAKTHDNCHCRMEPVFTAYEPSAQIREWQALYREATAGVSGSHNMQKAWRQAFEGRDRTVLSKTKERRAAPVVVSPDQARHLIDQLESSIAKMRDRGGMDAAVTKAEHRIAELRRSL